MSDPPQKPGSIPSLQRGQQPQEEGSSGVISNHSSTSSIETLPRAALLDKASKFLKDDEIREASTESKISFLEGKGLAGDEIKKLLGASWDEKGVEMEVRATAVAQEDVCYSFFHDVLLLIQYLNSPSGPTQSRQASNLQRCLEVLPTVLLKTFLL